MSESNNSAKDMIAFPHLNAEQIDLIAGSGLKLAYAPGEILVHEGDANFSFYMVLQGSIHIWESSGGAPREIAIHGPGQFSGDIDMLTGRRALFQSVAGENCRVIKVSAEDLRALMRAHSNLGDLLLNAFLMRRDMLLESGFTGVRIIGSRWSQDTFRIRDFLARNHVPFTWLDLEKEEGIDTLLAQLGIKPEETPIILYANNKPLKNPSNHQVAHAVGIPVHPNAEVYDLVVVGGGPAGLAAAVYGASEGLKTVVIEASGPGGQASWSSKIENYLGFPTGLSGSELASRAMIQAEKFGVEFLTPCRVEKLTTVGTLKILTLEDGEEVRARSVIIATGAAYRRLPLVNLAHYEGSCIFYSATAVEATMCLGCAIAIVGGGNSAGQAAVYLAQYAADVHIFIRGESLDATMSRYLIRRIEQTPNIHLATRTTVTALHGQSSLHAITVQDQMTDQTQVYDVSNLFVFIGAKPHTAWLTGALAMDEDGFIKTGNAVADLWAAEKNFPQRSPYFLETSLPGVFAAGDVRAESVKRVASAVGEGAMAVMFIHRVLAE